jgi:hypothetical protein
VAAHHDRPLGRDQAIDAIEGLPKERGRAEERNVLFGPFVAEEPSNQGSQPTSLAAGQDDSPGIREPGRGVVHVEERLELESNGHGAPPFVTGGGDAPNVFGFFNFFDLVSMRRSGGAQQ